MMNFKLLRLILILFFLSLLGLNAQDWYVATGGNDGGAGTIGDPFATIQHAIDVASPGEVIQVGDGTFTEDLEVNTANLTLQSENGSGLTTIQLVDGVGINLKAGATDFELGIALQGFTILSGGSTTFSIQLENNPTGVTIEDNSISTVGNASQGISVGAAGADDLTITDNEFLAEAGDLVIWAPGVSSLILVGNTITGPGSTAFQTNDISGNSIIDGNTITGFIGTGGITFYGNAAGTTTISNNSVTSCSNAILIGHPGVGSEVLTGFTITGNTLSSNTKGLYIDSDAGIDADLFTVIDNDFSSNATAGIDNQNAKELTAEQNWWGDIDPTDNFIGSVDYSPWYGDNYVGDAHLSPWTWYTDDSVQDAIDAATADDVINVLAGTYNEDVIVNKKLQIIGAGNTLTIITPVSSDTPCIQLQAEGTGVGDRMIIQDLKTTGANGAPGNNTSGIEFQAGSGSYTTIQNVVATLNDGNGIATDIGASNTDLLLDNCDLSSNGLSGLNINTTDPFDGLTITDCIASSNLTSQGLYLESSITNLTISGGTFSNNGDTWDDSGIWIGHLTGPGSNSISDVTTNANGRGVFIWNYGGPSLSFDNVTANNNTQTDYTFMGGITIYNRDASLTSLSITNSFSNSNQHSGIYINAYNAAGSIDALTIDNVETDANSLYGIYINGSAAQVDNISITNSTITDNDTGFRLRNDIGDNTAYDNTISGNSTLGVLNETSPLVTLDFEYNWWGDATGPYNAATNSSGLGNGVSDDVDYSPWYGDVPGTIPMTYYTNDNVQDVIDNADPGDTIYVLPGTYSAFVIDKSLTLIAYPGAIINNGSPAITVSASNVTIDGFTFDFNDLTGPPYDYAIEVTDDYSDVVVKNCTFDNQSNGGTGNAISNDNGGPYYVYAYENNDWGNPSGPTHASNSGGSGNIITDYVIYEWSELLSPIHSISGISVIPTFVWSAVGTGPSPEYKLIVSKNADLSAPIYSQNVGTDTSVTIIDTLANFPLTNNTKYYWNVEVYDTSPILIHATDTNYFYTVSNLSLNLSNPADGSEAYYYDPLYFNWYISQAQGSLEFLLQIKDTTAAPGGYEWENHSDFEYDNLSTLYKSVNGLSGGTKYFWRVIAYYDNGASSSNSFDWDDTVVKFSTIFEFDTKGGAVKAYPSWPIGGNTVYTLEPTFYWYTMQYEPSATFDVLYSISSSTGGSGELNSGVTIIAAGSNMYATVAVALDASEDYYWQVKTTYGSEVNYSSVAEFTTYDAPGIAPTKPYLSYPTGGITIYTTSPTMYWYIGGYNSGSLTFEVFVDDGGGYVSKGTTSDTYLQIAGLTPGETYDWKVVASAVGYPDAESDPGEFTVAGGMGSSVVLAWPTGNPTVYSSTPTLSWYVEGSTLGWDSFIVRWKKGSASSDWDSDYDGTYTTADLYETYYTFGTDLEAGETYYWAVALYDGSTPPTDAEFSSSSFTIYGGSATVTLTYPSNNSTILSQTPTFYWYVSGGAYGIDKYKVTYSNTELFTANVVEVETVNTYAAVSSSLDEGTTYWWYVSISYDGGSTWSVASATWKFTVSAGASPVMPLVGSPVNGVSINTDSPVLSWFLPTQTESQLSYQIELADNPEFNNAVVYNDITKLSTEVSGLKSGEYFWRVRSKANGSMSGYSNIANFKVGPSVTDVEEQMVIPEKFYLNQNYPNPFNPSTIFEYSLPKVVHVTFKIYDLLGREVATLVNQEQNAGVYRIQWDGTNEYGSKVSSGTYIYRITAGENVQMRKMVLLK